MPKELMNEAERYLLEHWEDARLLEESMGRVRAKYKELIQRTIDAVVETHPELNASAVNLPRSGGSGSVGLGRKEWPCDDSKWPSGLRVWDIRIEELAAKEADPAVIIAPLWISKKIKLDFDAARVIVNAAANELLTAEELKETEFADKGERESLIWLPGPTKRELHSAISEGDGQKFVDLMVSQFDMMARFVPALDQVFRDCMRT